MLRTRRDPARGVHSTPGCRDPIVSVDEEVDPEQEALLADSVWYIVLLVVLESLTPAERLAFVLHDMFGMAFDEIAPIVDRSPEATRQLASRGAPPRARGPAEPPTWSPAESAQGWPAAFLEASRKGDFEGLLSVLDPDVVLRTDHAMPSRYAGRGSRRRASAARQALRFAQLAEFAQPALVNGEARLHRRVRRVGCSRSQPSRSSAAGSPEMDFVNDPEKLARIDLG